MRTEVTRQIWDSAPQGRVGAIEGDKWRKKKAGPRKSTPAKKKVRLREKYPIPKSRIFLEQLVFFSPEPAFI